MSKFRNVVVIGAGGMGRAWLDAVSRRTDLRVCAVVDLVEQNARAAVEERGWILPVYDSIDAALAEEHADFVVNVTVPEAHLEVSSSAVRAGVPVLSEKPVTPTVAQAMRLAALSHSTGVLVATSQSRRYSSGIAAFRNALREHGGAGQLVSQFFQNPRFGGFREQMAHPLLVDMAIHTFDQARFVLDAEPESVYCEEFNPHWSWYTGGAAAEALFCFEGGTRFSYSGSWCADGFTTSWNGSWRGIAPEGTVRWDGETGVSAQGRDGHQMAVPLAHTDDAEGMDAALAEFVATLDGEKTHSGEIQSNIWSLAMVEAAVQSAEGGARVELASVFSAAYESAIRDATDPGDKEALSSWTHPYG